MDNGALKAIVGMGEVRALFFHGAVFDESAELFQSSNVEVDGSLADVATAYGGNDNVFLGASQKGADHQDGDSVGAGEALRNVGCAKFFGLRLDDAGLFIPGDF